MKKEKEKTYDFCKTRFSHNLKIDLKIEISKLENIVNRDYRR